MIAPDVSKHWCSAPGCHDWGAYTSDGLQREWDRRRWWCRAHLPADWASVQIGLQQVIQPGDGSLI